MSVNHAVISLGRDACGYPHRRRRARRLARGPGYFVGKPDLYHALRACLIPLYPTEGSLTRGILDAASPERDLPQPAPL